MTDFDDMTNAQLKEACEDFGLEVKAKNPQKPNKTEYLEALNAFKSKQDAVHGRDREEEAKVAATTPKGTPGRKVQSEAQLQRLELFAKERVIVRDMRESQTKDEMISVSWGNRLIGMQTDWVDLSGEPQYVRVGAIENLKDAPMIIHSPKAGGGDNMVSKKRFVIVPVEPLTDAELKALAAVQSMRNSKLA